MRRTSLNEGWSVRQNTNPFLERLGLGSEAQQVTLPHDALISMPRSPSGRAPSAYFPGGTWEYSRALDVSAEEAGTSVFLEFEGIYRDALVFVNDNLVASRPSGYADFIVPIDHLLRFGASNDLKVEARTYEDSRWYAGAGIYRSVWLHRAGRVHLAPGGLQVLTPDVDQELAVVTVGAVVCNRSISTSEAVLRVEIVDAQGAIVAREEGPVTTLPGDDVTVRRRVCVARPHRWGPDHPYLYTCRVVLLDGGDPLDEESTPFGVRTLSVDPKRGLRINGEPVLLRGACVHHDNGLLGAATIDRAEERRVELLKDAGFNAIRSAHNPMSRPMLTACDHLGMLVMDEISDVWAQPKSDHDYALRFADWWEADVAAMVRKDFNHPSVILYSIGNEIPEAGKPLGARLGRAVAEKVRSLDGSRFVTQAISGLLVGGAELFTELREGMTGAEPGTSGEGGVNTAMTSLADRLSRLMLSPVVAKNSAETLSYLDVAGYNYMDARFEVDAGLYPDRVIVGSETHPASIGTAWTALRNHPHVIGDFTWTGWDYLGEVGIGRVEYGEPGPGAAPASFLGEYPWLTAWCGDIDITGHRRPQSYYREIVFGLRSDPYIAVRRPQHHGEGVRSTPWSWTDVVSSWSWDVPEGAPVTVEVYADADEVELVVNGRSVGRRPAGAPHRFHAEFETTFEAGLLEAVARRGGAELGRTGLRSASGPVLLEARADRSVIAAHLSDLAFVELTLVDAGGAVHSSADRRVDVRLDGPAVLQGLGSANPASEESFGETFCTTFGGRALAVVRPTGAGQVTLTATAQGCPAQRVRIDARP